ncbi:fluoride efflux transporter CrcB [Natronoarchaeum rubrum]|uniref:fluoride efflux transporter CrcB n=1 Tax=Natronoarchaeum rubrum TaxID=755311 RepID=UPI0021117F15|nr:fluoride efflux transporter CrcB [Natronoarchaeum rubrum]HMB50547.1 fluoride efflux transporter CrcB [Natronoarchaeum rubrum]
MEPAHLVGTGGAIGAVLRYAVGQLLAHDRFPFSTLAVNVAGSFVLGLVVFASVGNEVALLVGTGACGSFTTYSSFSVQSVGLWEDGDRLRAALYALGTLCLCVLAAGVAAGVVAVL